jgi:hypothetical protein
MARQRIITRPPRKREKWHARDDDDDKSQKKNYCETTVRLIGKSAKRIRLFNSGKRPLGAGCGRL